MTDLGGKAGGADLITDTPLTLGSDVLVSGTGLASAHQKNLLLPPSAHCLLAGVGLGLGNWVLVAGPLWVVCCSGRLSR